MTGPALCFDTSGPWIAAAVSDGDGIVAQTHEARAKGQAEVLMGVLERLLNEAGRRWSDLAVIGVGTGPGNFTGIRISVSAARGLALGLGIPAVGLTAFELLTDPDAAAELVVVDAPRGSVHAQAMAFGHPVGSALSFRAAAPPPDLLRDGLVVVGPQAQTVATALGARARPTELDDLPLRLSRALARKVAAGHDPDRRPAPVYIRPPDAAPAADSGPVIVG